MHVTTKQALEAAASKGTFQKFHQRDLDADNKTKLGVINTTCANCIFTLERQR